MNMLSILGHAVSIAALATLATQRRRPPAKSLPESSTLAGVPLRRLLDDPCGPGAVLRDRLTHHPPNHH
jgi:hypothetical protein